MGTKAYFFVAAQLAPPAVPFIDVPSTLPVYFWLPAVNVI